MITIVALTFPHDEGLPLDMLFDRRRMLAAEEPAESDLGLPGALAERRAGPGRPFDARRELSLLLSRIFGDGPADASLN